MATASWRERPLPCPSPRPSCWALVNFILRITPRSQDELTSSPDRLQIGPQTDRQIQSKSCLRMTIKDASPKEANNSIKSHGKHRNSIGTDITNQGCKGPLRKSVILKLDFHNIKMLASVDPKQQVLAFPMCNVCGAIYVVQPTCRNLSLHHHCSRKHPTLPPATCLAKLMMRVAVERSMTASMTVS